MGTHRFKSETEFRNLQKSNSATPGKGPPTCPELGNHRRIINISDRSREDECTDVGIINVVLHETRYPSWTELY